MLYKTTIYPINKGYNRTKYATPTLRASPPRLHDCVSRRAGSFEEGKSQHDATPCWEEEVDNSIKTIILKGKYTARIIHE